MLQHGVELGEVHQCPLPPPCHHQTCTSTGCSPHPGGDSGVVAWPSGRGQKGTRGIEWFSIWTWMRAGVFLCFCGCVGFFSNAGTVLKMLRTWRGSAAEVFEASQLVFPSTPFRPGRHGQPEACPTDRKPAEPWSGFAAALVPTGLPAALWSQRGALRSPAVPRAGVEG